MGQVRISFVKLRATHSGMGGKMMRGVLVAALSVVVLVLPVQADFEKAAQYSQWSYSGDEGPEHWADLDPAYRLCREGKAQSPIDLRWSKPRAGLLNFHYVSSPLRVVDTGHTVQVNFKPGSTVLVRGKRYNLLQLHFHSMSEHTISSRAYPMEAHFVHERGVGERAVIAVMFQEGQANEAIEQIWSKIPKEKYKEVIYEAEAINPMKLIPRVLTRYYYLGSQTTPPCTEGVSWNILNTPLEMSRDQIEAFRALYAGNNRPVQPLNGRRVMNH